MAKNMGTDRTQETSMMIAQKLLNLKAVQINVQSPFTWVSGVKSPIYCDNRKVNSDVETRREVVKAFVDIINDKYKDAEAIAGIATGGISFGALIADKLNLPFIYVRQA